MSHMFDHMSCEDFSPDGGKPSAWELTVMVCEVFDEDAQVFFMIGSQRSGSNWLRTMLNEREDLAAPHPPHILREFEPILAKFGDIDLAVNAEVLVDHVLLFVERNQVMWTDKHGSRIKFTRIDALHYVLEKMAELRIKLDRCTQFGDS